MLHSSRTDIAFHSLIVLAILPLLVGWLNDYVIYTYIIDISHLSEPVIRLAALFDIGQRLLLPFISFLIIVQKQSGASLAQRRLPLLLLLGMGVIESTMRSTSSFIWVNSNGLPYKLAASLSVSITFWALLPLWGVLLGSIIFGFRK